MKKVVESAVGAISRPAGSWLPAWGVGEKISEIFHRRVPNKNYEIAMDDLIEIAQEKAKILRDIV